MPIAIGITLAIAVGLFATLVGFDKERAFYSTVLLVVASYYALFAVLGGSLHAVMLECGAMTVFIVLAAIGFRTTMWLVAAGLLGHGLFDLVHGALIANPGMPHYWPAFCSAYDVAAAGYLATLLLRRGRHAALPPQSA
ncbi:MAG: hypothetical protein JSR15_13410 [Proteobacteria bacterium]|nr:hypothetical protein [Pseudomonadota bacterium]